MRIGLVGAGRIGAFHAGTLAGLPEVDEVVVTDAVPEAAAALAERAGHTYAADVAELLDRDLDGLVITSSTASHAELLRTGIAAGLPTFCEKPMAGTLAENVALAAEVEASGVPVHLGFQRRFDDGYLAARAAVASGELGFVHTIRANTHDQSPPPAGYLPTSGGLFRDCNLHDFDIVRFVSGREVVSVFGRGANQGDPYFTESGDVDTAAALLTLDDDTLVLVSATRYNGAGHDVRLEVLGSRGAVAVGLDHSLALDSAETGVDFPRGPRHWSFMERFLPAYQAELTAYVAMAQGRTPSPCTVVDALAAFRVAEACDRSRLTGLPVELADVQGAPGATEGAPA